MRSSMNLHQEKRENHHASYITTPSRHPPDARTFLAAYLSPCTITLLLTIIHTSRASATCFPHHLFPLGVPDRVLHYPIGWLLVKKPQCKPRHPKPTPHELHPFLPTPSQPVSLIAPKLGWCSPVHPRVYYYITCPPRLSTWLHLLLSLLDQTRPLLSTLQLTTHIYWLRRSLVIPRLCWCACSHRDMPAYCSQDCHYFYRTALRGLNICTTVSPLYS